MVCGLRSFPPTSPTSLTPTLFFGSVLIFQYQRTALHLAIIYGGHSSCVALLIEHGANLEAIDEVGSEVVVRLWWWRERGARSRSPALC